MFKYMEQQVFESLNEFNTTNIQELCRAFIFTKRGSKQLYQVLQPRITSILDTFTPKELCYILYGFHKAGYTPKPFLRELEANIIKPLKEDLHEVPLDNIQLMC